MCFWNHLINTDPGTHLNKGAQNVMLFMKYSYKISTISASIFTNTDKNHVRFSFLPVRKLLCMSRSSRMLRTHSCLMSMLAACSVSLSDEPRHASTNLHGSPSTCCSMLRKLTLTYMNTICQYKCVGRPINEFSILIGQKLLIIFL